MGPEPPYIFSSYYVAFLSLKVESESPILDAIKYMYYSETKPIYDMKD